MNLNAPESGIASTLASRGRRGDSMLVHMAPEEVKGLQALALAHGGSLTINPQTGLYEANILKKLLPTIIGAVMPSIPGLGTLAKTVGFGNATLGTGLLVGGATALIEGDLKKGLEAGLGAYSGANITQSLRAASTAAAPAKLSAEQLRELPRAEGTARELVGATEVAPLQSMPKGGSAVPYKPIDLGARLSSQISSRMPSVDLTPGAAPVFTPTSAAQPSVMGGIKSLFTSPESRTAFGEAMGGGFKSPFMQNVSRAATYTGLMNAMTPKPKPLPTGGAMGEDYVYIPGGFNPLYGTGRDQPYQLPGKYYKRTAKGLVPFDPFALAPGVRGFADGGQVGVAPPKNTPFAELALDPNVAATRAYIEDLNRRAKNPETFTYPGMGSTGLGGMNEPYVPGPYTGGGGGGGGGGAGSVVGTIAGQYLVDKGIGAGVDYLKEKFFPTEEQQLQRDAAEEQARRDAEAEQMQKDVAAEMQANPDIFAALPAAAGVASLVPPPAPAGTVTVGEAALEGDPALQAEREAMQQEIDARARARAPSSTSVSPAAISAASGVASLVPNAARAGQVIVGDVGTIWDAASNSFIPVPSAADLTGVQVTARRVGDIAANSGTGASGTSTGIFGLEKGAPLTGKAAIIPGLQTVLGLHQAYEGIRKGNEVQSALGGFGAATGAASLMGYSGLAALGPIGLAAAAVAALGSSMVNTKEYGDKALENYWKAVDQGRGFGQAPPEELAQGFINFYRTNKNEFAGQAKYGRTGNEDFVYDMTQVINDAVKSGKIGKGADATTIYEQVVQPWLGSMGPGPQNEDARRVQDFMMTDLIHNFMKGAPISNAQVKGDKNFKIVSERPVYAGTPPSDMQMYGQMPAGFQGRPNELRGIGRDEFRTPFSAPEEREFIMPTPFSEPQAAAPPPPTPFSEPQIVEETAPIPYSPRIIDEEPAPPAPPPQPKVAPTPDSITPPPEREEIWPTESLPPPRTPFSEPEPTPYMPRIIDEEPAPPAPPPQPKVAPTPFSEPEVIREPEPVYRKPEPEPTYYRQPEPEPTYYRQPEPEPTYYRQPEPEPTYYRQPEPRDYIPTLFREEEEEPRPRKSAPSRFRFDEYEMMEYAMGGAVGEDYNFGFARGGMPGEYQAGGKLLDGPGDGMSDDIPAVIRGKGVQRAALADGEFVIPADVVSHLGNGSTKAGAKKLYDMMARVRKARTGKTSQAPAVKTNRLLPV